ncbi:hypothetical protein B7P43_G08329 [Cryptotermes secundus]|uniref:Minor histocompatibility antigen H13 n=1 Tax=Cryptotermes secundus TaxID=105785 RepID=A0A2J7RMV6_9NEOP|nr:hypothetical protein B7P43_G08329 [Cryptotermes secundus]
MPTAQGGPKRSPIQELYNRYSTSRIATSHRLDDRGVGVTALVGSRIFSSPHRPDWLWGPPNLLSNWYRKGSFHGGVVGVNLSGRKGDHSPPASAKEIFVKPQTRMDFNRNKSLVTFPLSNIYTTVKALCIIFFEEYVTLYFNGFTTTVGILSLYHLMRPVIRSLITAATSKIPFNSHFTKGGTDGDDDLFKFRFWTTEVVCLVCCSTAGAWYIIKKDWIARTLLGIAMAIHIVQFDYENKVATGCIIPCVLFVGKILWVTAATSFDGPIKLIFPQDFMEEKSLARNVVTFGMLEFAFPGRFIAMLLRFDNSLKRNSNTYFNVAFAAYFVGLTANIFVTHVFKYTLPPLLYLVPACVGTPMLWALLKGDIKAMFQYEDFPSEKATDTTKGPRYVSASVTATKTRIVLHQSALKDTHYTASTSRALLSKTHVVLH